VCLVFGSILKFACLVHEPQAVFRKRDSGNHRRDRAAPCAPVLLVSVVLIGRAIASVYKRVPTTGPTVVEFRMWFFVGASTALSL
jgi:hypothetical protein